LIIDSCLFTTEAQRMPACSYTVDRRQLTCVQKKQNYSIASVNLFFSRVIRLINVLAASWRHFSSKYWPLLLHAVGLALEFITLTIYYLFTDLCH
jgi:hypothetical protein